MEQSGESSMRPREGMHVLARGRATIGEHEVRREGVTLGGWWWPWPNTMGLQH